MNRLDGDILGLGLGGQLFAEGAGRAWVCLARPNGEIVHKQSPFTFLDAERQIFAKDLVRALNREAWLGGAWLVAWTDFREDMTESGLIVDMATRLVLLWKDADGDVPFTIDDERPFPMMVADGIDSYLNQAHMAWDYYNQFIQDVGVTPDQMVRQARGQRATGEAPEQ